MTFDQRIECHAGGGSHAGSHAGGGESSRQKEQVQTSWGRNNKKVRYKEGLVGSEIGQECGGSACRAILVLEKTGTFILSAVRSQLREGFFFFPLSLGFFLCGEMSLLLNTSLSLKCSFDQQIWLYFQYVLNIACRDGSDQDEWYLNLTARGCQFQRGNRWEWGF